MATVDSTTTEAELKAAFRDNASYEEDASVAKARAMVTICMVMLERGIRRWKDGDQEQEFSPEILLKMKEDAARWANANDTTAANRQGRVTYTSFENFRS